MLALDLPATDHRIVLGKHCDYLIGKGVAHAFSKEGLYILSDPVPTVLNDLGKPGGDGRTDSEIGPPGRSAILSNRPFALGARPHHSG
jgi:hypothetical protein